MIKLFISLVLLTSLAFASSDEAKPFNPEIKYIMSYDKNTTCLVRQILVHKEPRWVAKIEVRNGKVVYFSSPKAMFEFYHRPAKWFEVGVKSERDFFKIIVTDYTTQKPINAETAFYVYGSRAISPGGDDLPAFGSKELAQKFMKEFGGTRIFKFDKIPDALIKLINGRI